MDKHNNISEFDNLFKQSFEGASNAVPPGVWEGVSSATTGAGAAAGSSILSKIVGLKGAAIIGSVAVIVTTVVVINSSSNEDVEVENSPVIVEQEVAENNSSVMPEVSETAESEVTASESIVEYVVSDKNESTQTSDEEDNTAGQSDPAQGVSSIKQTHENGNPIDQDKNTPIASVLSGNIFTSSETVCVNQKVDFTLQSKTAFKSYMWWLNGQPVKTKRQYVSFLFDEPGMQRIEMLAVTENGQKLKLTKSIDVKSASADFKVSQENGIMQLTAIKALKENQWFANQVLIKENQPSIQFNPTAEQTVFVHMVTNLSGCKDTVKQTIFKKPNCDIDVTVPNVFTPSLIDVDGYNDDLTIDMPQLDGYRLTIYNFKDGNIVFDSENQDEKWNGRFNNVGALVPGGRYLYKLSYTCDKEDKTLNGKVTVIIAKN